MRAAASCCAVKRAADIDQARIRNCAVARTAEAVEHALPAGRCDRKDRTADVRPAVFCCAVERAANLNEAGVRLCAISRTTEAMDRPCAGRRDQKERALVAGTAT